MLDVVDIEAVAQEVVIWMFFSQVGRRHSILKEELVNGRKNFNRTVQNRLSLVTEFYTHHTRFLFVPNPKVVSYRP